MGFSGFGLVIGEVCPSVEPGRATSKCHGVGGWGGPKDQAGVTGIHCYTEFGLGGQTNLLHCVATRRDKYIISIIVGRMWVAASTDSRPGLGVNA